MKAHFIGGPMDGMCQVVDDNPPMDMKCVTTDVPIVTALKSRYDPTPWPQVEFHRYHLVTLHLPIDDTPVAVYLWAAKENRYE